ncbi:OmpA family protein [Isoptericola variabilis]|uniref:OmpA/MotB domain protein n=1 Tax=Isoptericola variabilis (strain 225) TaxID=743718 RepID=F6FPD6_ISOV2|nr:OmpA family protein [Isoptericola variabilis]AEG43649.1 OmpA/MotB domain protein [Isoptericola variabilis 225]TWH27330.1 flagellar motor protein MotB [Isoptericola variabilis J7]TWH31982.1 flagellar motor protein MotB [Isoptericola variabilis J7]
MRRPVRRGRPGSTNDDSYWISFSDLMSALLLVFLLAVVLLVVSLTNKEQELVAQQEQAAEAEAAFAAQRESLESQVATLSDREETRAQLVNEIAEQLRDRGIRVEVSEDSSVLHIPTSALGFDSGSYDIRPAHQPVALTIGTVLADALRKDERYAILDTVFVEGHTDNAAFGGLEGTGNWGLSTFRAISLWRLWDAALPQEKQLDALRRDDGTPIFSVSGYAESRPVEPAQLTEEQRAANRRIDLRFTVKGPTADELATIVADVSEGATAGAAGAGS